MIRKLGYYLSRPGHYLSITYCDVLFRIFLIILIFKLLLFNHVTGLGAESFFPSLGFILAILSFSLLIKNNVFKFFYLFSFNLLCSLLFFTHALYFKYFGDFASVYHLNQIHQLGAVSDIIIKMINKELLFIVDLPFLPFLLFRLRKINSYNILGKIKIVLVLLSVSLCLNVNPLTCNMRFHINYFESIFYRDDFVSLMGIFNYQVFDTYYYLLTKIQKTNLSKSDINAVMDWKKKNMVVMRNDLTGIGKGENLIVIQVESLQNFVIGRRYNGKEITPNLNKLVKEGVYFNNIYDQTAAGNSSDATFLANSSLYPSRKGAVSFLYSENCFDSLPKVLREHDYTTAVMLAYKEHFWNTSAFDKDLGFEQQSYEDAYIMTDEIGGCLKGLSDKSFFSQSIGKIKKLQTPFYAVLRTLSTHTPFVHITTDIDNFALNGLEGKMMGYYIRAMHYVDSAIGEFLYKLSENNFASNTIIVIYGDHRARLPESELELIGVHDLSENKKIPLIIHLPNRKQKDERDTIGGLIDVAPTLFNILGIDASDKFFMGRDIGNRDKSFVIFRDGSFICRDGSMNPATVKDQLMISDLIIEKDMIPLIRNRQNCQ
jgi:lipoteichoic acid synthase